VNIQQLLPGLLLTGSVSVLVAAPAWAQVVQVTGIQLNPTPSGVEVILETTDGATPQVFTSSSNQTVVVDIANAQLNLASGKEFRANNPVEGIAAVTATNLNANSIQVRVTGKVGVPTVEVFESDDEGLILSLKPAPQRASQQPSAPAPETPSRQPEADDEPQTPATQPEPDEESQTPAAEPEPAAEAEEDDIEVVVTATRTEEEVEDVPRSVTVITREEIEQQTNVTRNLGDILGRIVPGFEPPNSTNRPNSLRGRPPAILIDGVRQQSNDSFSPLLSFITPDAIERIEVVPGPSGIYGQGATGGIINIITRRPSEERLTSTTEVGVTTAAGGQAFLEGNSFGYFLGHLISGTEGDFDYTFNVSGKFTNSFFDAQGDLIPNGNLFLDDTQTIAALGKVGVNFNEQQRLQLTFNHTRDFQEVNSLPDPIILEIPGEQKARAIRREVDFRGTDNPRVRSTNFNLNYTHENLFGSQVEALAYYRESDYIERTIFDDRGGFFDGIVRTPSSDEVFGGRLQIETPLFNTVSLLWGTDYEYQNKNSVLLEFFDEQAFDESEGQVAQKIGEEVYIPAYDLDSLGLFAQLQWDVTDSLILSGGVRHERIGLNVDEYTPRYDSDFNRYDGPPIEGGEQDFNDTVFNVGAVFKVTPELSLFANFAQGFSVPGFGFGALGFPPPGFSVGEDLQGLQPQQVDNYEIGVRGNWDSVEASLAGFFNYSDLGAALVNQPDGSFEIVRSPQRNYGFEATLDWQPGRDWQLGSSLSYVIGENDEDDDGEFLDLGSFDVPPLKLTTYVEHQTTPGWRNRLQLLYVGDRDRGFEDGSDPVAIEDYLVVDLISSIQLGPGTLVLGVENLFNNQYQSFRTQLLAGNDELFNRGERGRTLSVNYRLTW
jgi:iron complex outermembrane receptor protein